MSPPPLPSPSAVRSSVVCLSPSALFLRLHIFLSPAPPPLPQGLRPSPITFSGGRGGGPRRRGVSHDGRGPSVLSDDHAIRRCGAESVARCGPCWTRPRYLREGKQAQLSRDPPFVVDPPPLPPENVMGHPSGARAEHASPLPQGPTSRNPRGPTSKSASSSSPLPIAAWASEPDDQGGPKVRSPSEPHGP